MAVGTKQDFERYPMMTNNKYTQMLFDEAALKLLDPSVLLPTTLNKTRQGINGILTLGIGKLTIPAGDTLEINGGTAIGGAPFSDAKYIYTAVSGANAGQLRINGINSGSMLFPVGAANFYLPVTLSPEAVSDHSVSVFTGITEVGLPGGTDFTVVKKASVVDAAWIINRPNGTGNCSVSLQWESSLEGAAFVSYANNEIGVARHDGASCSLTSGSGDNTLNTSTSSFSEFISFGVGRLGIVLPMVFKNISAIAKNSGVEINWEVALEEDGSVYEIERSGDQRSFVKMRRVAAANSSVYNYFDQSPLSTVVYHRIKNMDKNGEATYSRMASVRNNRASQIEFYPNPVVNEITFSGLKQGAVIRIAVANGQVIRQQVANASFLRIRLEALDRGMYFAAIISPDGVAETKKFIK